MPHSMFTHFMRHWTLLTSLMKCRMNLQSCGMIPQFIIYSRKKTLTKFCCAMSHSYPNVTPLSLQVFVPFASTYLCESGFQFFCKLKQRQEIDRMFKMTWDWHDARISKLVTQMQPQLSHKWLILCHICSVKFTFLSNIFI